MAELNETLVGIVDPSQASTLSVLVDLEARWENLKKTRSQDPEAGFTLQDLQGKQKAYEAFRTKLMAYNKRFRPAHVPEALLNTPTRLAAWCRSMRDLYLKVEHDGKIPCPVHLLEKAYRWADMLAARLNKPPVSRWTQPSSVKTAIRDLEVLAQWCDELVLAVSA